MTLKEDIEYKINSALYEKHDEINARVVPTPKGIELRGGSKSLEAAFLYADLVQSSYIIKKFNSVTASKIIKIYLTCMCKLIRYHGGEITSFDGDRVMGVFIGDNKNNKATLCALKMGYVVSEIINPAFSNNLVAPELKKFKMSHCVGIDCSNVTVVKAGIAGSNDLIWVGRAPNLAAKLSEQRYQNYTTYISKQVFLDIDNSIKFTNENFKKSNINMLPNIPGIHLPLRKLPLNGVDPVLKILGLAHTKIPPKPIWGEFQISQPNNVITTFRTNYHHIV